MAAGKSSVHCWPTDEAQDVIKTLRSRGCCSIGQRLMLGSKRLKAFQSLAGQRSARWGCAAAGSSRWQHLHNLHDGESYACISSASDRPLLLVCSPADELSGTGATALRDPMGGSIAQLILACMPAGSEDYIKHTDLAL